MTAADQPGADLFEEHGGLRVADLDEWLVAVGTHDRDAAARAINSYLKPRSDWTVGPDELNRTHVRIYPTGDPEDPWEVALAHPEEPGAQPAVLML